MQQSNDTYGTTQTTPASPQPQIKHHVDITEKQLLVYLWYIVTAKGGNKVLALLLGQWNGRYENRTLAMIALANYLVFWADGSIEIAYRMFCCSRLYRNSKDDAFVWNVLHQAVLDMPANTPKIIYALRASTGRTNGIKSKLIVAYIITVMYANISIQLSIYIDR